MRALVYDAHSYDQTFFDGMNFRDQFVSQDDCRGIGFGIRKQFAKAGLKVLQESGEIDPHVDVTQHFEPLMGGVVELLGTAKVVVAEVEQRDRCLDHSLKIFLVVAHRFGP